MRKTKARHFYGKRTIKPTEPAVRVGRHLEQRVARVEHGPVCEAEYGPQVANIGDNARVTALCSAMDREGAGQ